MPTWCGHANAGAGLTNAAREQRRIVQAVTCRHTGDEAATLLGLLAVWIDGARRREPPWPDGETSGASQRRQPAAPASRPRVLGRRSSLAQPQSGRGTPSRAGGRLRHHGIGTAISAFAALHPAGEGRELPGPSDDGSTARVSAVLTLGLDYLPSPLRIARSGLRSRPVRSRPISSVLYTTVRTPVLDSRPTVLDVLARLSEGPRAVHVCTARSRVFKIVQPSVVASTVQCSTFYY